MKKLYPEAHIQSIANAIREKLDVKTKYTVGEMADAIMSIPTGGTGSSGMNYLFLTDAEGLVMTSAPHNIQTVWLTSDTVLSPELTSESFSCDFISSAEYVNDLLAKLTLKPEEMDAGETFTIRGLSSAYLHKNGNSLALKLPIRNTLDDFEQVSIGRQVITSTYSDGGTCSVPTTKYGVIPCVPLATTLKATREPLSVITVSGDCLLKFGDCTLYVNGQDNGYQNIYLLEIPIDDVGNMTRVTWDGYMPYSRTEVNRGYWDIYFISNGDFYIRIGKQGTNSSGTYSLNGISFTNPGPGGYVSFYRKDYMGSSLEVVNEQYDVTKHYACSEVPYQTLTFEEAMAETDSLSYFLKSDVDDSTYTINNEIMPWPIGGNMYSTFYVSTNSWIGVTGNSEQICINRRDAKAHRLLHGVYELTDLGIKCYKIRWVGYAQYNISSTVNQIYDVYFFENGDAMIRMEKMQGDKNGTYTFFDTSYSISEGECVSFYRKAEGSSEFTAESGLYDISKHKD